jgi:LAO/AO transport system kinase
LPLLDRSINPELLASRSVAARRRLTAAQYIDGILEGNRVTLARAITVIESDLSQDAELSRKILDAVLPYSGRSCRVGITGVPGAGKSTFIDALGMYLVRELGEKIAVLSVDPSSPVSGGSILGDKTRMEQLASQEQAFIRPSPARGHLGGVARRTRETMLLCEAAGYSNIIVETVGVGQSEIAVRSMTDFFLLLMIPGAGDELQGIKRGIIEQIDGMVINKSDGDNKSRAERARVDYASALRMFPPGADGWKPRVLTCSALHNQGVVEVWELVQEHRRQQWENNFFQQRRSRQALDWMRELIALGLEDMFRNDIGVRERLPGLEQTVKQGSTSSFSAAQELLAIFRGNTTPNR